MPKEESSHGAKQKPDADSSVKATSTGGGNQQPPGDRNERHPPNDENGGTNLERDIRDAEGWLIGIGVATVIVNLLIASIYYGQLSQMRKATEASTNAVHLAQDSFEISSENFDRQMRQMVYQTAAEIKAANAAKRAAEITAQALADSRREAIIENGAVLSITDLGFPKPVANSQFVKWEWAFENYGRTPAVDVTVQQELYVGTSSHTCWREGGGQPRATPTVEFPAPIFRDHPETGSCLILTEAWGRFGLVRYEQLLPVKGSIKLHLTFRYSDAYGTYTGLICLENAGHADGDITPHAVLCDVPRWTKERPKQK